MYKNKMLIGLIGIALTVFACSSGQKAADKYNKDAVTEISDKARFIPNRTSGASEGNDNIQGFRCISMLEDNDNPFYKAGIQVDDVVLAVDERELKTSTQASFYFDLVLNNQYSSIRVQRGARVFTLKKVSFTEEEG